MLLPESAGRERSTHHIPMLFLVDAIDPLNFAGFLMETALFV
jgi:hypothetical protein